MTDQIVSSTLPPEFGYGVKYWERSSDPWHPEAFVGVIKFTSSPTPRRSGWMAIDWIENPIGFVPNGTKTTVASNFKIKPGPYGRDCAYQPRDEPNDD